ncbi:23S rRNA (adenine(2030)-N(6))-methyltransferase RlmJ [Ottowia thiooxydans]|uniref:23S rRNA (adenine(2030)-N(6))-methyltransferase RlmJ n=1 Tax=Ottowia thiooxydans TaxID=219182 RepID=UPI0003F9BF5B|nr:23S rRNA (adenine(2030)-N(6))-methyltransferase RlmJ [Ottowia thiooxydans]
MFSYRHAFHAGSHADVLKHLTLIATLRHLMQKPTPLTMVDTHAGAGLYRLDGDYAQTSGEAAGGILRLAGLRQPAGANTLNDALADYLEVIDAFNTEGKDWRIYPGSPFVIHHMMNQAERSSVRDRLKLFELHPTDSKTLEANIAQLEAGRQITVTVQDGFEGLKTLLPPPPALGGSRRALVLMDPSYEIKTDYAKVQAAMQDALRRFPTGVYLVWYPIIARPEAHDLPRRLKTMATQAERPWLHATLSVGAPEADGSEEHGSPERRGLTSSGMFVINPPHSLKPVLEAALPQLLKTLGMGSGKGWQVEAQRS